MISLLELVYSLGQTRKNKARIIMEQVDCFSILPEVAEIIVIRQRDWSGMGLNRLVLGYLLVYARS